MKENARGDLVAGPKWQQIAGPSEGNGFYTDRLRVPEGYLYRETYWGTGGFSGTPLMVAVTFAPSSKAAREAGE